MTEFHLHLSDLQGVGDPSRLSLPILVALSSAAMNRSTQDQMVVLGSMTLGGTVSPVDNLANALQVAFDAGSKRVLIPMANAADIASVPPELFTKFQTSFYSDPVDAVFKALGVN